MQAGAPSDPPRGQESFISKYGREWSCTSCHGNLPTQTGRHVVTGKLIVPLAPASNPEYFTDTAKAEKWFQRNYSDVVGCEYTVVKKADVLSWLMTLGK